MCRHLREKSLRVVSQAPNILAPDFCRFPSGIAGLEPDPDRIASLREHRMASERRKGERVSFERGINAHMMGIDGTWRRNCIMEDISETGARLTVEGSVEGLNLKEFFLLLSSTGLAYRRCELAWVNGDQVGATFLKQTDKKKGRRNNGAQTVDA
jgi:PilZ domain